MFLGPCHSKNGGGALSVTPVRASIQFKFGMLIYNIKTQVELDLGYNPLIFDWVMGLL